MGGRHHLATWAGHNCYISINWCYIIGFAICTIKFSWIRLPMNSSANSISFLHKRARSWIQDPFIVPFAFLMKFFYSSNKKQRKKVFMHKVVTRKALVHPKYCSHQQCPFRGTSNFLLQLTQAHASKMSGKYYDLIGQIISRSSTAVNLRWI